MTLVDADTLGPTSSGAELLGDVEAFIRRFVVVTDAQACAIALWVAHTHAVVAADATPYLAVTSPERRSGKTRLLEALDLLARRPVRTANISEAALFRIIEEESCTVMLDEGDTVFGPKRDNEGLRGLFNAGYRRGVPAYRCEVRGKQQVVKKYDAFGPKVLAAIRQIPETIADRSIPIRLQRKQRSETVDRFRIRRVEREAHSIRDALAAWLGDAEVISELQRADPALPSALHDRAQDGWEPLLAIADMASPQWAKRARISAVELHEASAVDDDGDGVLLLAHIKDAFEDAGVDEMSTSALLEALCEREDGLWAAWWGNDVGAGKTQGPAAKLAKRLKPYGVMPQMRGPREDRFRGYSRDAFEEAFSRYLDKGSGDEIAGGEGVDGPESPVYAAKAVHTYTPRSDPQSTDSAPSVNTPSDQQVYRCTTSPAYTGGGVLVTAQDADADAVMAAAVDLVTREFGADLVAQDADRVRVLDRAASMNWPTVVLASGKRVGGSRMAWQAFARNASGPEVFAALERLREQS